MDLQQCGHVETEKGTANAMLCIDAERQDELLVQLWGVETELAIRFRGALNENTPAELEPVALYRVNDRGGLWLSEFACPHRERHRAVF